MIKVIKKIAPLSFGVLISWSAPFHIYSAILEALHSLFAQWQVRDARDVHREELLSWNHRIPEWIGLEATLETIQFQLLCHRQGHQPLDQSAPSPVQPVPLSKLNTIGHLCQESVIRAAPKMKSLLTRNEVSCNFSSTVLPIHTALLDDPKVLTMFHPDSSHPVLQSWAALLPTHSCCISVWAGSEQHWEWTDNYELLQFIKHF